MTESSRRKIDRKRSVRASDLISRSPIIDNEDDGFIDLSNIHSADSVTNVLEKIITHEDHAAARDSILPHICSDDKSCAKCEYTSFIKEQRSHSILRIPIVPAEVSNSIRSSIYSKSSNRTSTMNLLRDSHSQRRQSIPEEETAYYSSFDDDDNEFIKNFTVEINGVRMLKDGDFKLCFAASFRQTSNNQLQESLVVASVVSIKPLSTKNMLRSNVGWPLVFKKPSSFQFETERVEI